MRVLVCGGRKFDDWLAVYRTLEELHFRFPITLLVHGAATGADTLAGDWASFKKIDTAPFPADWDNINAPGAIVRRRPDGSLYNVAAGFWRNQEMLLRTRPALVIAFPGKNGTQDMINRAIAFDVPVRRVRC